MKKRKKIQKLLKTQYLSLFSNIKKFVYLGKDKSKEHTLYFFMIYCEGNESIVHYLIKVESLKYKIVFNPYKYYISTNKINDNTYNANINDDLSKVIF